MDEVRELVFNMTMAERSNIFSKYKAKTPTPLNSQFTDKSTRAEAVEYYIKRKQQETVLYPSGGFNSRFPNAVNINVKCIYLHETTVNSLIIPKTNHRGMGAHWRGGEVRAFII